MPEYIGILSQQHIEELKKLGDVQLFNDYPKTDEEIIKRIGDAEIVLFKWIKITAHVIENCPSIHYAIALSIGTNFIDKQKAQEKGIVVINSPTHNAHAVAEHVIGLIFAISRNIVVAQNLIRSGKWKDTPYMFSGSEIVGKKLGLIGYGNIGKEVELLASGLGMKVSYLNSKSSRQELDDLISSSDYISISIPYTEKVHHLIDGRRLAYMKKSAYIVNTARGEIIDQKILFRFLKERRIAGAALDVFENEPINAAPGKEIVELANLSNVVATPHIGYNTPEAALRLGDEMIKNVKACIAGNPVNVKIP